MASRAIFAAAFPRSVERTVSGHKSNLGYSHEVVVVAREHIAYGVSRNNVALVSECSAVASCDGDVLRLSVPVYIISGNAIDPRSGTATST
jgi:hypothetical protein